MPLSKDDSLSGLGLASGFGKPRVSKPTQASAVAEGAQVAQRDRIVEVVKGSMQPWLQDQGIEYLADPADGFSGLLTFTVTTKDVQGTGADDR